jgi:hypothetical protein
MLVEELVSCSGRCAATTDNSRESAPVYHLKGNVVALRRVVTSNLAFDFDT